MARILYGHYRARHRHVNLLMRKEDQGAPPVA